jgi:zinc protease
VFFMCIQNRIVVQVLRCFWQNILVFLAILMVPGLAYATLPIESWRSESGARVMFMHATAIPMVDIQIDFDAGTRRDPQSLAGLAGMTRGIMEKGAGGLKESALEDAFADVGAQLGGGVGADRAGFSLRSLVSGKELEQAVQTLTRILQHPDFPVDVLQREQIRAVASLREANTKPEVIAKKTFMALMYGSHPYGYTATEDSIKRIGVDDLRRFYQMHYRADNAVVSIVGAIDRQQAQDLANRLTLGLPNVQKPEPLVELRLPPSTEQRIAHPSSQSHVLIGLPVIKRNDPDFFPLIVGNYILGGGGFVSRVMTEVREKRGLAYSAYAYFSPMIDAGPFEMGLQTQKSQTNLALKVLRDTLNTFLQQGPTAQELKAAKDNLVGGFPLRLDSNKKLLDQISTIAYYNLPDNYLETWTNKVQAVTAEQIRDAFARRILSAHMVTVVVGEGL